MIEALSAALFHFIWQGVILALVPTLALMFRSPRIRYGAACVALCAMPIVFVVTFALSIPDPAARVVFTPQLHPAPAFMAMTAAQLPQSFNFAQSMRWFVPFWVAGVVLFWLRIMAGWVALQRLRRTSSSPAPEFWKVRLQELAARLGILGKVALFSSALVDVPVVAGFLRPAIFVPAALFTGMPAEQLEYLLIHELAHIRRFDYAVNLLQKAVEGLLFYHPAVWWVSRILHTERENCCDDTVVALRGNAREYAFVLASLEQSRTAPALAASGGNLARRVVRLLRRPSYFNAAPVLGLVAVALSATVAWAALQNPQLPQLPAAPLPPAAPAIQLIAQAAPKTVPQAAPQQTPTVTPDVFRKWLNEDVAYIITSEERAAFTNLITDEERDRFIEQFWLRRDPTPGTTENEFKKEQYRRIAYANTNFSDDNGLPGWKTDRGRIYITFGPPDEIDSHPSEAVPFEKWQYRYIEGIGSDIVIDFKDSTHTHSYAMTRDPAEPLPGVNIVPKTGGMVLSVPLDPAEVFNIMVRITQAGKAITVMSRRAEHQATAELPFALAPGVYKLSISVRNSVAITPVRSFATDFTVP